MNNNSGKFCNILYEILIGLACITFVSCKKFLELDAPVTSTNADNVYVNNNTAAAVVTGIYSQMSADFYADGFTSLSVYPELSADNLVPYFSDNINYANFYKNQLVSQMDVNSHLWLKFYPYAYTANAAIEGLSKSISLTPEVKNHLLGEAMFLRALTYFYLVNIYGDVPLVLSTDYKITSMLPREKTSVVYEQIVKDLKDAVSLLSDEYVAADIISQSSDRVRPNKSTAQSLLARVFLYEKKYQEAKEYSSIVIAKSAVYTLEPLDNVFLNRSREAIWQLQPVVVGENTREGRFFTITVDGPTNDNPVYLSSFLLNSFESKDERLSKWISTASTPLGNFSYPSKYKVSSYDQPVIEYSMVLRLAEQYLIRAEARLETGDLMGAMEDINAIRKRAGLGEVEGLDKPQIMSALLEERRHEFFTELGHRWFDLKRTGKVDDVMSKVSTAKGGVWNTDWQWYPIPVKEIRSDINIKQNSGYR